MVYDKDGRYDEERLRKDFDHFNKKNKKEFEDANEWWVDNEYF